MSNEKHPAAPDPNENSIAARLAIACSQCGCEWTTHPEDCPRHAYRPKPPVVHSGYVAIKAESKPARKRKGKARA